MKQTFNSIDEVAQRIGDGGEFCPDAQYDQVCELVDALVAMGNEDKVLVRHDDHEGLKDELSQEFLNSSLEGLDPSKFEYDMKLLLEQANIIIPLFERNLSEDDVAEIEEDREIRGVSDED
jgi:hypothetical protein